jgi:uncharacterized protein (TIGR02594 family)
MIAGRTRTLLLLCSVAFLAAPALAGSAVAKPVRHAEQTAVGGSQQMDGVEVSANRRRHRAVHRHGSRSKRVHVPRHGSHRAAQRNNAYASVPPMAMHSDPSASGSDNIGAIVQPQARVQASAPVQMSGPERTETRTRRGRRVVTQQPAGGGAATFGGGSVVAEARRWIGTNPTGRSALWCAHFMNFVLQRSGHSGSGSGLASSFASYGKRISGPQVGAIAVMSRGRRGGHVGVVSGIDAQGNPIIISGNHGRRVGESTYSRGRVYAYVMP